MAYFNAKFERERKQRDNNPQRIAMLAKQKGRFEVSLRWRDDGLRRVCQRMVKRGELRGGRRERDRLVFYPCSGDLDNQSPKAPDSRTDRSTGNS